MKKAVLLVAVMFVTMTTCVNAQTQIGGINAYPGGFIPPELTFGHIPLMQIGSMIVNKNLEIILSVEQAVDEIRYFDSERLLSYGSIISAFSQTLFNDDEDFEYITYTGNTLYVKKVTGAVIFSHTAEAGYDLQSPVIVRFGDIYYLFISEEHYDNETHDFNYLYAWYRINRPTQSITRVEGDFPMRVFPSVADRSQTITVELGEGNNATEVQVVNSVGQVMKTVAVQPGQREVKLRASDLNSGMHIVGTRSRVGQGACKIIVK